MIIRAKHTCESDLRAFCTKMHLKHLLHKQPTPKSFSYIILNFPPISTLYIVLVWKRFSGCFEEICFASSPQVGRLSPHAGRSGASTYYFPCLWSSKNISGLYVRKTINPSQIDQSRLQCDCKRMSILPQSTGLEIRFFPLPVFLQSRQDRPNLLTICEKWGDPTAILNQP